VIDQLQGTDGSGEMIVEIGRQMLRAHGVVISLLSPPSPPTARRARVAVVDV
jgi:hypothetical protein